ncbi:MAG: AAA family ATPase [Chitinophagales bacterium]
MLIGRKKEIRELERVLKSPKGEMIAVLGRRRVGKTFLINETYKDCIVFEQIGVRNASNAAQLNTFTDALQQLSNQPVKTPKDWQEAFFKLRDVLKPLVNQDKKLVIFFDELSWLAVKGYKFLDFLGHFWNSWASRQNIAVVLCGSATSWIIQKVINDKGGLHNRVTTYINLKPFTLAETEEFLKAKHANFTHYQIIEFYMTFGGIPLYLDKINPSKSAIQNINDICFAENGLLRHEFGRLYPALFDNPEHHIAVIRALAKSHKGLTRTEIIELSKIPNGRSATQVLEELQQCSFIMAYQSFGKKKKDKIYRLTDEYSLFYLRFIEEQPYEGDGTFMQLSQLQTYKTWTGYAFENVCMKHILSVKKALGVSGVYTRTFSFLKKATETEGGLQIDMLLERADRVIDLFEIKFYNTEFTMTKAYAEKLRRRTRLFMRLSKTKYQVRLSMITPFGLKNPNHSPGLLHSDFEIDSLFL